MKKLINYIGQLRVYSLVDLILMLCAVPGEHARASLGAVFLWVGFLAFLESLHKDKGREPVNQAFAWCFWIQAANFLGKDGEGGTLYITFSILYSFKKQDCWARFSPLMRGLQTITMLSMVSPTDIAWYWLAVAALLIMNRNFWGDARDTEHDAEEGVDTWPVALAMKDWPLAHLLSTFLTSFAWWAYAGDLSFNLLLMVFLIQIATYWLTPRQSNKKAAQRLRQIFGLAPR